MQNLAMYPETLCTEALDGMAGNLMALAAAATSDISPYAISADASGFSADLGNYDMCQRQQSLVHCLAGSLPLGQSDVFLPAQSGLCVPAQCGPQELGMPSVRAWVGEQTVLMLQAQRGGGGGGGSSSDGDVASSALLTAGGQQRLNYLVKLANILQLAAATDTGFTCGDHAEEMTPDRWLFMAALLMLVLLVAVCTASDMMTVSRQEAAAARAGAGANTAEASALLGEQRSPRPLPLPQHSLDWDWRAKVVDSFSLVRNVPYVFASKPLTPSRPSPPAAADQPQPYEQEQEQEQGQADQGCGRFAFLDGMRVLSMVWVILGHTLTASTLNGILNPATLLPPGGFLSTWPAQLITSARFAVETFFFVSGFVVTVSLLRRMVVKARPTVAPVAVVDVAVGYGTAGGADAAEAAEPRRTAIFDGSAEASCGSAAGQQRQEEGAPSAAQLLRMLPAIYVHRVLRILPPYVFCLLLWWKIGVMMGDGPFWMKWDQFASRCDAYWWANVLFVNNLVPYDSSESDQCFYVTWYLAIDMQYYVVAPFFAWVYLRSRRCGVALVLLATVASVLGGYAWALEYHASAHSLDGRNVSLYSHGFYTKPQFRFPAYGLGMLGGMLHHWHRASGARLRLPPLVAKLVLAKAAVVLLWLVFFASLSAYQNRPCGFAEWTSDVCGSGWSREQLAAYAAFSQPAWSACLLYITLLGASGQGYYLTRFLGHRLWGPPAKLSFAVYLLHVTVINLYVLSQTQKLRYSHFDFAVTFAAVLFLSVAVAMLVVVFIESPACRASKHLERSLAARFGCFADAPGAEGGRQSPKKKPTAEVRVQLTDLSGAS